MADSKVSKGEAAVQSTPPSSQNDQALNPSEEEQWNARMAQLRVQQGLDEDAMPEIRDIRYQNSTPESAVTNALREAGDPRGGKVPAMGFEEHQRAGSDAHIRKSQREAEGNLRFFIGQRGWIENPGYPDHGRAVGIVRISEYASVDDEVIDSVQGGRGKVKTYECTSRDGRAETLFVSAEHFRPALDQIEWGRGAIVTPNPGVGTKTYGTGKRESRG